MVGVFGEFPRGGFLHIGITAGHDLHCGFDGGLDLVGFHGRIVGCGFFLNEGGERGVHAAQDAAAVAFRHAEGAVQQVAEAVGELSVVALLESIDAEVGISSGGDVAE